MNWRQDCEGWWLSGGCTRSSVVRTLGAQAKSPGFNFQQLLAFHVSPILIPNIEHTVTCTYCIHEVHALSSIYTYCTTSTVCNFTSPPCTCATALRLLFLPPPVINLYTNKCVRVIGKVRKINYLYHIHVYTLSTLTYPHLSPFPPSHMHIFLPPTFTHAHHPSFPPSHAHLSPSPPSHMHISPILPSHMHISPSPPSHMHTTPSPPSHAHHPPTLTSSQEENVRLLHLALHQGQIGKGAAVNLVCTYDSSSRH